MKSRTSASMPGTRLDRDHLVATNPLVDRVQADAALRMVRNLRAAGHLSRGYELASPYARKRRTPA